MYPKKLVKLAEAFCWRMARQNLQTSQIWQLLAVGLVHEPERSRTYRYLQYTILAVAHAGHTAYSYTAIHSPHPDIHIYHNTKCTRTRLLLIVPCAALVYSPRATAAATPRLLQVRLEPLQVMHALGDLALDALPVDVALAEACHVVQEGLAVRNLIDDLVVQLLLVAHGRGGGGGAVGAWVFGQNFLRRLAVELVAQRQLILPGRASGKAQAAGARHRLQGQGSGRGRRARTAEAVSLGGVSR